MMRSSKQKSAVKILIVEDSPTQAQQLCHVLEQHGYEVSVAANGRVALEMMPQIKPALVISDVNMPVMDGYELCRSVKGNESFRQVPVMLVTGMSEPQDVMRGLECGADSFVIKPYHKHYLLQRVHDVLLNHTLHEETNGDMGLELYFEDRLYMISAGRRQILNLLVSTYDAAIQRNKALSRSHDELRALNVRLDSVNHELESFSYSVSHNLRTPLRHIGGFVDLLEQHVAPTGDSKGLNYVKVISESCQRMGRLIDDLLGFSHMARVELTRKDVNVASLLQEVIQDLGSEIKQRQINWKIANLPVIQADLPMMRQVFTNLISNAIKYTRTRELATIEVGVHTGTKEIIFFVRDNGVGFDMKFADKLFEVFQRLHRAENFEGSGIGLANVRRIIARYGGHTWAEGGVDAGATFYFSLPDYSGNQ